MVEFNCHKTVLGASAYCRLLSALGSSALVRLGILRLRITVEFNFVTKRLRTVPKNYI